MPFWEDDLALFFTDFAIDAEWAGKDIKVIFHNAYEAVSLFGADVESKNPFLEVKDSDIEDMGHDETITIAGVAYLVRSIQADGTGISLIMLSKD